MTTNATVNSYSRVFIVEGRHRPDHKPAFQSCLMAGSLEQNFGDVTDIECPSPNEYGKFDTVGQIRGAEERVTLPLSGIYDMDVVSTLASLAKKGCAADVHVHFGTTETPKDFDSFTKAIVVESGFFTNWSTDDLGTLSSDNQAAVNENSQLSGENFYELVPVNIIQRASTYTLNEIVDGAVCDPRNCGTDESDGCDKFFFIAKPDTGSPGTNPDLIFTLDGGTTWYAEEVTTMGITDQPGGIECFGSYVVITDYTADAYSYVLRSELDGVTTPTFTEVTTGFVAAGSPLAIHTAGTVAFIVGDGGYVYLLEDVSSGVTVLDAGSATSENLVDVHAISEDAAVAVGANGAVIYTTDGSTWAATSAAPSANTINAVVMLTEDTWLVGDAAGSLYYTTNKGVSWTEKTFTGSGSGEVTALGVSNRGTLWLAHQTTATRARLLRSYNGGYSWKVLPEGVGSIPAIDKINSIAACDYDPNAMFAAGIADDGTAGAILMSTNA